MIELMKMEKAKSVACPTLPEDPPEDDEPLGEDDVRTYRSCVGIALYVMSDRPDIQRDVQIFTRSLKASTMIDYRPLVRLVRYLKGAKTYGMLMNRPRGEKGNVLLELYMDTDYAQRKVTRRAITCGVTVLDKTVTSTFARRQGVQSTSPGEAEFCGATCVVMDGRIVKHCLEWIGYQVHYNLLLDSSVAKSMVQRDGVGNLKHMDVRGAARLRAAGCPSPRNLADFGTKAHHVGRFSMLGICDCTEIGSVKEMEACRVQVGRAEIWAPARAGGRNGRARRSHPRFEGRRGLKRLAAAPSANEVA